MVFLSLLNPVTSTEPFLFSFLSLPCTLCFLFDQGYLPDGARFDSSRDRGKPFKFKIGSEQVYFLLLFLFDRH